MRKNLRIRMHNIISKPILRHDSEIWVLENKTIFKGIEAERKLETSEMRLLQHTPGVTLIVRIRSEYVGNSLGQLVRLWRSKRINTIV